MSDVFYILASLALARTAVRNKAANIAVARINNTKLAAGMAQLITEAIDKEVDMIRVASDAHVISTN